MRKNKAEYLIFLFFSFIVWVMSGLGGLVFPQAEAGFLVLQRHVPLRHPEGEGGELGVDAEGLKVVCGGGGGFLRIGVVIDVEGAEPERIALLDERADVLEAQEARVVVCGEVGEFRQFAVETDVEPSLGARGGPRGLVFDGCHLPEPVKGRVAHVVGARN